jgi:hypothetical protein
LDVEENMMVKFPSGYGSNEKRGMNIHKFQLFLEEQQVI